jgi:glutathione S-transferase
MITLYHCDGARSFRPLWMLEEMGLAYELKMLPFPPRVFAKDYLALNPLGTIPLMIDGELKMTESSGICHYLGTKHGPTPLIVGVDEPAYGAFLNWMYFSDATLTFPQTLVLRYSQLEPEERRNPQVSTDYAKWFFGRLRAASPGSLDPMSLPIGRGCESAGAISALLQRNAAPGWNRTSLRGCGRDGSGPVWPQSLPVTAAEFALSSAP